MSRFVKTMGIAAAAAATFAIAAPANAAATWTVSAGSAGNGVKVAVSGKTTGTTPQIKFSDTTAGQKLTCDSGSVKAAFHAGSGQAGANLAQITGTSFKATNCTGPGGLTLLVSGSGTWQLSAASYNATTGTTTGTISSITAHVQDNQGGTTCSFDVTGTVAGTYKNSTTSLKVLTANSTLTLSNANCLGILNNGDHATFSATYKIKATNAAFNPVHVTSP